MTPLENVLSRLEKVQRRQPGKWSARCPAHANKGPSLTMRETSDGSVLLHCFTGCTVTDVVDAIGLEITDLFPPKDEPLGAQKHMLRLLTARHALDFSADESLIVVIAAGNIGHGVALAPIDIARVLEAARKINYLHDESKGY